MDPLRDIAEFQAVQFAPVLPDECQVNPQVYGAELAFWLCISLARQGVNTSYPVSEDWGWFLEYITQQGSEFAIHCGNVDGANDKWLLSLRRYGRKLLGRDKPPYSDAAPVITGIRNVLKAEAGVSNLRWLYDDLAE